MKLIQLVDQYLHSEKSFERIQLLDAMNRSEQHLPIDLGVDLLSLELSIEEKVAILKAIGNKKKIVLEDFLSSHIRLWDQNLAGPSLIEWATRTDCIMGHRALSLCQFPNLPQRLRYILLDLSWFFGGSRLVSQIIELEGSAEMSPIFQSMLSFRALQFNIESEKLIQLAKNTVKAALDPSVQQLSQDRVLPYFIAYLLRFEPEWCLKQTSQDGFSAMWSQYLSCVSNSFERRSDKAKKQFRLSTGENPSEEEFLRSWPVLWERHSVSAAALKFIFTKIVAGDYRSSQFSSWEFYAGIPSTTHITFMRQVDDPRVLGLALNLLGGFLEYDDQAKILDILKRKIATDSEPQAILSLLSPKYTALLNVTANGSDIYCQIAAEREKIHAMSPESQESFLFPSFGLWEKEVLPQEQSRRNFFRLAYRGEKITEFNDRGDDLWKTLSQAWNDSNPQIIESLSVKARKSPALFQICYINVLGRFRGSDKATLKLLDFIRSEEEPVLRAIVQAFSAIGTPRAVQELVAFLTRPNMGANLQLEIAQILREFDLTNLQAELHSVLNDLNYRKISDSIIFELRDAISSLLHVSGSKMKLQKSDAYPGTSPLDLDAVLNTKIKMYDQLSSEVRRALRTAQFFHFQVEHSGHKTETIDLSPVIDMQYKALELCLREKFEQACNDVIREGTLQRKLDLLGYARPIPHLMDQFEDYIETLPIIQTIPFFSRFKLRKMLRAICQYRPGKRFTLDGLKAFAIFFICFSRHDCKSGLSDLFPVHSMDQNALLQFCKELHLFQDYRNRAVHEGFHPDASSNLESIWDNTATIFRDIFTMAEELGSKAPRSGIFKKIS